MARPLKALVVDDLPVNRLILGTILHKLGFEVLEAENGLQCIDMYNQERTQLVCVFLDLQMPVADGWVATKGIRKLESQTPDSGFFRVPVVLCTASCLDDLVENGQTVAQRALSLGADGAVRKPLTTNAVERILDEFAPRWRSSVGVHTSANNLDASGRSSHPGCFSCNAPQAAAAAPHSDSGLPVVGGAPLCRRDTLPLASAFRPVTSTCGPVLTQPKQQRVQQQQQQQQLGTLPQAPEPAQQCCLLSHPAPLLPPVSCNDATRPADSPPWQYRRRAPQHSHCGAAASSPSHPQPQDGSQPQQPQTCHRPFPQPHGCGDPSTSAAAAASLGRHPSPWSAAAYPHAVAASSAQRAGVGAAASAGTGAGAGAPAFAPGFLALSRPAPAAPGVSSSCRSPSAAAIAGAARSSRELFACRDGPSWWDGSGAMAGMEPAVALDGVRQRRMSCDMSAWMVRSMSPPMLRPGEVPVAAAAQ